MLEDSGKTLQIKVNRKAKFDQRFNIIEKIQTVYLFKDCLSSLIFCCVISPLEKSKTSSLKS